MSDNYWLEQRYQDAYFARYGELPDPEHEGSDDDTES